MPNHRNEPAIYSGKVLMLIGVHAGRVVPMDYTVAQSMVASGQARWEGDASPMPRHLNSELARQETERQRQIAADAAHAASLKAQPKSIDDAVITGAKQLVIDTADYGDGNKAYLARPFPQIAEFAPEVIGSEEATEGIYAQADASIAVRLANASAIYDVVSEKDGFLYAELREFQQPEADIPADWQDRHFLANMATAKKIRDLDNSAKMTKDEAQAIIQEWTSDDQGPVSDGEQPDAGAEAPRGGDDGKRILDGNHEGNEARNEDGNQLSPEEAARQKEREFAEGDDDGA